jgi:hypothetical protein
MRRPAVTLFLMGAVLLLTVGAALAAFKGFGDDGKIRASLEENNTPVTEDGTESRTTPEKTTSEKETTSETDKKTKKADRKTRAERDDKPKAEKVRKTARAGKGDGKSTGGKGGVRVRGDKGGNAQQASGRRMNRASGGQGSGGYVAVPVDMPSQAPEQATGEAPSSPASTKTPIDSKLSPGTPGAADVPAETGPDGSTSPEDNTLTSGAGDTPTETDSSDPASPDETDGDDITEPDTDEVSTDPDNPTSPEDEKDKPPKSDTEGEPTGESSGDTPAG